MDACPHCGVRLPEVVDAFCPECRVDLSTSPEEARMRPSGTAQMAGAVGPLVAAYSSLVGVAVALAAAVTAVGAAADANWPAAGGSALTFLLAAGWVAAGHWASVDRTSVSGYGKARRRDEQP